MSFDFNNLQLFVRAAALGAIGRAGLELGHSSTNASQRVKALEDDLGVKLFHRTTRSISLTSDGKVFLEHAQKILNDLEEARAVVSSDDLSLTGILRVTTSATYARHYISPVVPIFLDQYPGVQLDLNLSDSVVDIVEQGYDLAFRIGELAPSSLLARRLCDNPQRLVASPDYIARRGEPETPEALHQHICLPMGATRKWSFEGADNTAYNIAISGPVNVNLGDTIADWVLGGMGIGQASLWQAGPDILAGKLVIVLPEYRIAPETNIWAVRPPGKLMPRRVQAFLDLVQDHIEQTNVQRYGQILTESLVK